jgi:hypothetical protein
MSAKFPAGVGPILTIRHAYFNGNLPILLFNILYRLFQKHGIRTGRFTFFERNVLRSFQVEIAVGHSELDIPANGIMSCSNPWLSLELTGDLGRLSRQSIRDVLDLAVLTAEETASLPHDACGRWTVVWRIDSYIRRVNRTSICQWTGCIWRSPKSY